MPAAALGSEFEEALRKLIRQLIREELAAARADAGDVAPELELEDVEQLATSRAAELKRARSRSKP